MIVTMLPTLVTMMLPESRWPPGAMANPGSISDCDDYDYDFDENNDNT